MAVVAVLLSVHIRTVRQVRLHCSEFGTPIFGDDLYGQLAPSLINRLALHAMSLSCTHPVSGKPLEVMAPLADDIVQALRLLRLEINHDAVEPEAAINLITSQALKSLVDACKLGSYMQPGKAHDGGT